MFKLNCLHQPASSQCSEIQDIMQLRGAQTMRGHAANIQGHGRGWGSKATAQIFKDKDGEQFAKHPPGPSSPQRPGSEQGRSPALWRLPRPRESLHPKVPNLAHSSCHQIRNAWGKAHSATPSQQQMGWETCRIRDACVLALAVSGPTTLAGAREYLAGPAPVASTALRAPHEELSKPAKKERESMPNPRHPRACAGRPGAARLTALNHRRRRRAARGRRGSRPPPASLTFDPFRGLLPTRV
jgi:hypothetical protein